MDHFPNRLTGRGALPGNAFFFEHDYWTFDEKSDPVDIDGVSYMPVKSVTNGQLMSDRSYRRFYGV